MTIDEDDAVEEKEKSNIELLSDAFRKQILQMQEDSKQQLQKRLIEMNTKELHVKKLKQPSRKIFCNYQTATIFMQYQIWKTF